MSPATARSTIAQAPHATSAKGRIHVSGKFLFSGEEKFYVRGVTYGTFRPNDEGFQYPDRAVVEEDFARMAESGFNSVRLYTPPPEWVLDTAKRHGLYAMIGLCWEQPVAFLANRHRAADIEKRIQESVRSYAGHPAVLCHAVGNEIPAAVVRWHGRRALERFIHRLYRAVKEQDPECPVTYVNFPTTEYLDLPFLDLCCFNVYLENRDRLED